MAESIDCDGGEEDEENGPNVTVALTKETAEWLDDTYPDGKSRPERVRMAISDARLLREMNRNRS